MSIKPLRDYIVVKQTKKEAITPSGIVLPGSAVEKPNEGTVVAVGRGVYLESGDLIQPEVQVGNKVLFGKFSGTEVTVDNNQYLILKESDIMGVLS